jgi:hypothetical protein
MCTLAINRKFIVLVLGLLLSWPAAAEIKFYYDEKDPGLHCISAQMDVLKQVLTTKPMRAIVKENNLTEVRLHSTVVQAEEEEECNTDKDGACVNRIHYNCKLEKCVLFLAPVALFSEDENGNEEWKKCLVADAKETTELLQELDASNEEKLDAKSLDRIRAASQKINEALSASDNIPSSPRRTTLQGE